MHTFGKALLVVFTVWFLFALTLTCSLRSQPQAGINNLTCNYYITLEDRTTMQFYPPADWPIVKARHYTRIWVDENAPIFSFANIYGKCGTVRIDNDSLLDTEDFSKMKITEYREVPCELYEWSLREQLSRRKN